MYFNIFFLILVESLKVECLNDASRITKIATPDLLKIKVFWNKGYEWIISIHESNIKILSSSSNYKADVAMWPHFGRLV